MQILDRWAAQVNPLLKQLPELPGRRHRWVIDQAEYSTDVLFKDRATLAPLYAALLDHAALHFTAEDILSFLGRRLHPRFEGEVLTTCRKDRQPGARVKHRVKNNWLKMYDKLGQVLRIETVINQPREFRVRRRRQRHGRQQMCWCPMNRGVANFYHYHRVARTANDGYFTALATVTAPTATQHELERVSRPVVYRGRRRRGLNLLDREEQRLFRAVLDGAHALNGLCNRNLAEAPGRSAPEGRRGTTTAQCPDFAALAVVAGARSARQDTACAALPRDCQRPAFDERCTVCAL